MSGDGMPDAPSERPILRIVRGEPTDEELAALTAVLVAAANRPAGTAPPPDEPSWWSRPGSRLRRPVHPGPGAWRASGWPHLTT